MLDYKNLGRIGPTLVTAALGAIGAEVAAITTTDKAAVSLLPLAIEIVVSLIGLVLILCQRFWTAHAALGGSPQRPLVLTDPELAKLMRLCVSKTDLQDDASIKYYGRWVQITGHLDNVTRWRKGHSTITLREFNVLSGNFISMQISDHYEVERTLVRIARGTTLTLAGKINSIGPSGIILGNCKIMEIGQVRDRGPKAA